MIQCKAIPKKDGGKARTVIACTCRVENYEWIKSRRLYNLPLPDGRAVAPLSPCAAPYAAVTHIVVYARGLPALTYEAKYVRDVDAVWLADNGYKRAGRASSRQPHASRYALFELGRAVTEASLLGSACSDIYVCSTRWTGRIDDGFFLRPLPQCGGRSVPNIFERLRPFFGKWHSARAFNPVQMDFFGMIQCKEIESVPFPAPSKGKFTFIDLFAGIGGIRLGYQELGGKCVFSSEWDKEAAKMYFSNFGEQPFGDKERISA